MAERSRYPRRIPRERAVAALDLANKILDVDNDLRVEEQPGGFYAGLGESDETAVPTVTWKEWVELAGRAAGMSCTRRKAVRHG